MAIKLPSAENLGQPVITRGTPGIASYDVTGIAQGAKSAALGQAQGLAGQADAALNEGKAAGMAGQAARLQGETAGIQSQIAGAESQTAGVGSQTAGIQARTASTQAQGLETQISALGQIATADRATGETGMALGKAITGLGQSAYTALKHYQDQIEAKRVKDTALDIARAEAGFITDKRTLGSAIDDDSDYNDMEKRYREQAEALRDTRAGFIKDPHEQELWKLKRQADVETLSGKARTRAESLIKIEEVAADNQSLVNLQESLPLMNTPEERERIVDSVRGIYRGWQDKGYATDVEAGKMERNWLSGAGEFTLKTMPASQQVGALKGFEGSLANRESSQRPWIQNDLGYSGLFQFGAPRLQTMGVYTPGANEDMDGWSKSGRFAPGKWTGTFHIPGYENVKTIKDFLANPDAQKAAFQVHLKKMDEEITKNGFDKYEGKTVGGVTITRTGLYGMLHLGGVGGTDAALHGRGNASDGKTRVLDYAREFGPMNAGSDMAQFIPADKREELARHAERNVALQADKEDEAKRAELAAVKQLRQDDFDSILATGTPTQGLTVERVAQVQGPDEAKVFAAKREVAFQFHGVTHDWEALPEDKIRQKLSVMEPVAGQANFGLQQEAHAKAAAQAKKLIDERHTDPAAAADRLPAVQEIKQQLDPEKPETYRALAKARAVAQEQLQIPKDARMPITRDEARQHWKPIEEVLANKKELKDQLDETARDLKTAYGDEGANKAMSAILKEGHARGEERKLASAILMKVLRGEPVTPTEARTVDDARKDDAATKAIGGLVPDVPLSMGMDPVVSIPLPVQGPPAPTYPIPTGKQMTILQSRPELAATFDKHFGPGAAEKVLSIVKPVPEPKATAEPAKATTPEPAAAAPAPPKKQRTGWKLLRDETGRVAGFEENFA